jgi:hypothetical protein
MNPNRTKSSIVRGLMVVLLALLMVSLLAHRVFHPAR